MTTAAIAAHETARREDYLLAGRKLGVGTLAASIAASWMWAPALLVAAQLGYLHGLWGVFWFSIPNIVAVLIFGAVAQHVRDRLPAGYTYAGFQRAHHSKRVLGLFVIQDTGAMFTAMVANLVGGAFVLNVLLGVPIPLSATAIAGVALAYTWGGGFRTSTTTDKLYLYVVLAGVVLAASWALLSAPGGTLMAGAGGSLGLGGIAIAAGIGLTFTISLLTAPYSDETLWQRAWAAPARDVRRTFYLGGLLFAPVPIAAGIIGVLAAGAGLQLGDPQLAIFGAVGAFLPSAFAVVFTGLVIFAVVSTIDGCMSAVAAYVTTNVAGGSIRAGKLAMLGVTAAAVAVSSIPGLSVLAAQLLYAALRSSSLIPGLLTVYRRSVVEHAMFFGILAGFIVGFPVFAWGMFAGGGDLVVSAGMVLTVGVAGVVTYLLDRTASLYAKASAEARSYWTRAGLLP